MRRCFASLALVALLTACSAGGDRTGASPPPTTMVTDPVTTTTRPSTSTAAAASSSASAPVTLMQGANAAPVPQSTYVGIYDASEAAHKAFEQWWRYEVQTQVGAARGLDAAYADGVSSVCTRRSQFGPDQLAEQLKTNKGYNLSDAAAVVAAAQRALCPKEAERNISATSITGYLTYFDRSVASAYYRVTTDPQLAVVRSATGPTLYQVGWFAKHVCAHLEQHADGSNLLAYLASQVNGDYGASYLASPGINQRTREILVVTVVNAACTGYWQKLNEGFYS